MKILNLYKKLGETPKEALEKLRHVQPELEKSRLTYAGRLDPMAEGVLLVLEGDYTEEDKDNILNLKKQYYFEVLFGFKSDTFDILGLADKTDNSLADQAKLIPVLSEIKNLTEMPYPPFSSKTLGGVPLFILARKGNLDKSMLPKRRINIFSLQKVAESQISSPDLLKLILERISLVKGDFRQKEIEKRWQTLLSGQEKENFLVCGFRAEVSTGTYIRGLVDLLGDKLKIGALCLKIVREKVGDYGLGLRL